MLQLQYIKYFLHINDHFTTFSDIQNEEIKSYLSDYKEFICKTLTSELKINENNYSIIIGLCDFHVFCWVPVTREFMVTVSKSETTKELHFWELCKSLIFMYYPNYYHYSILKFPFIADIFTASVCLKLISRYGMNNYYEQVYAEFIHLPSNAHYPDIYNKYNRKASRFGRSNYRDAELNYLAYQSYRIGAFLQERLSLKALLMMGKSETVDDWLNYLDIDDRIFVRLVLSREHIKY